METDANDQEDNISVITVSDEELCEDTTVGRSGTYVQTIMIFMRKRTNYINEEETGSTYDVKLNKKCKAAKAVLMAEINKDIKYMRNRKDEVVMGLMPTVDSLIALTEIKEMAPSMFVLIKGSFGIKDDTIRRSTFSIVFFKFYVYVIRLKLFGDINHLGLSLSHKTTVVRIEALRQEYDNSLMKWKNEIEVHLENENDNEDDDDIQMIVDLDLTMDGVTPIVDAPEPPLGKYITFK
ncbi:unnamed protein product [Mytilus edulis]|uniref:Uncharacterized protein n=1 Tax=Mytilus edulis TaxID=6550 RepID=A0A8S3QF09_MYTED|nr:unnamed protein product [Mytilus edulis]